MTLSGYTVTRDCIAGDYCVEACVRSLSAVCDEVVVVDAMSTDGTRELVASIPKVRIVDYPRHLTEVFDDPTFLTRWMNYGRERLHGDVQLYLDADEVIDTNAADTTLAQASSGLRYWCRRLNFWGDH